MKFSIWEQNRQKRLPIVKEKILIIIRSPSGGGKSYKVKKLLIKYGCDSSHVFSTDNAWIPETIKRRRNLETVPERDELEEYTRNFPKDIEILKKAHSQITQAVKQAIDNGVSPIILDNTNVMWQHFSGVVEYADKAGYIIKLEEPESPWWKAYRPFIKQKREDKMKELLEILSKNNKHGVPKERIWNMLQQWQEIDLDEKLGKK
jgi:hypothetical protein